MTGAARRADNAEGINLFTDVHRWIQVQGAEIALLRARHQALHEKKVETVAKLSAQLEQDVAERRAKVNDFSLELEQYSLRKFETLKEDIIAAHLAQKQAEAESADSNIQRKQRQINLLCKQLDETYETLGEVAETMVGFGKVYCA
eukprot:TRINITY_DN9080_c0_g1_i2.p1 TRINITY_DN9080_c0_g1~~TRINITY_DN9080_c0_g1_i2.p1  ORF type:complete len:146 (-),score=35.15 TRINITY_DN9080_c0_g1_i2:207-644(-)